MKKFTLFLIVLITFPITMFSQNIRINGMVRDKESGEQLTGVSVVVIGTATGVITGLNGEYSITAPSNDSLRFHLMGYHTVTIPIEMRQNINVQLETSTYEFDEVVVFGYGSARRKDLTGSIVSLKSADFENRPTLSAAQTLQGKIPGMLVVNSGQAGGRPRITIRGVGSLANTNPLYVVDGVFHDNIDFLNPNEIASIDVLKDASSLALFGVQGANGVIIVTTKSPKYGLNIDINSYVGVQTITKFVDVANAEQFKMLYNEQLKNIGQPDYDFSNYTADTDWQREITRNAIIHNHSISISNASDKSKTYLSVGYFQQDGVIKYGSIDRFTARLNNEFKIGKHVKVGANLTGVYSTSDPTHASLNNALWSAPVVAPKYEENGVIGYNSMPSFQRAQVGNPVAAMEINKDKSINKGHRLIASAFAEVQFLNMFNWKSVVYTDLGWSSARSYSPLYTVGKPGEEAQYRDITSVAQSKSDSQSYQQDHTLTFNKQFSKHNVSAILGMTTRYNYDESVSASRQGFDLVIPDHKDFWYVDMGTPNIGMGASGSGSESSFVSYLARVSYNFADKYLFTGSYRRDGSSKFGPKYRWGNFYSVGGGWVISEERFMKNVKFLNYLKLKVSWGQLGNDKIGNYLYYPVLNTGGGTSFGDYVYQVATPAYLRNERIHWEVMEGTDIGVEFSMLKRRLTGELNLYNRETKDILVTVSIPGAVGVNQSKTNMGTIRNRGIEFMTSWNDSINDFNYSISGNISYNKNKVVSLGDAITYQIMEGNINRTIKGYSIGHFYGYKQEGIFQTDREAATSPQSGIAQAGDIKYYDLDGNKVLDPEDRTYLGSPFPKITYAMSANLSYKNISLNIECYGVSGNKIYNQRVRTKAAIVNYPAQRLNRWTGEGSTNWEPIMDNNRDSNFLPSDHYLESGSFFRIRNIQLGYSLPQKLLSKLRMKAVKVYFNAQNPITVTHATGYTPEIGGSPISAGRDSGVYPIPAIYTLGVNISF